MSSKKSITSTTTRKYPSFRKKKHSIKPGDVFGKLRVIKFHHKNERSSRIWECLCQCGNRSLVPSNRLNSGKTKSCGCLKKTSNIKHNMHKSCEYNAWRAMRERCLSKSRHYWDYYGSRGIGVCDRWNKFENFYADMGKRPSNKHSLDRIDNNRGYSPDNCRWATRTEQMRNTRGCSFLTWQGKTKTLTEWSIETGIDNDTIRYRITHGWSVHEAMTTSPARRKRPKRLNIEPQKISEKR